MAFHLSSRFLRPSSLVLANSYSTKFKSSFIPTKTLLPIVGKTPDVTFPQLTIARNISGDSKKASSGEVKLSDVQTVMDEPGELFEDQKTIDNINELISSNATGRLYCVVHVRGFQHKITAGDLVMAQCDMGAPVGERIVLEKVLLVGSKDFSLLGQPILPSGLVRVEATVLEKTLSRTKIVQYFKKREQYRRIKFQRSKWTLLRINDISFGCLVGETPPDDCV